MSLYNPKSNVSQIVLPCGFKKVVSIKKNENASGA